MEVGMCQPYPVMILMPKGNGYVSLDPVKTHDIINGQQPPRLMAFKEEEGVF